MVIDSLTSLPGYSSINIVSGSRGHGDSVREDKLKLGSPFDPPKRVYLVYISITDKGALIVHQKDTNIGPKSVSDAEDDLISGIVNGNPTPTNFSTMIFKEPSYLTVVLDIDDWDFYYPDPKNRYPAATEFHDPIIFLERKVILVEKPPAGSGKWARVVYPYVMNKSFFNSESISKTITKSGTTKNRPAVRCVNFLAINDDGDKPGQGRADDFGFNILVRVPYSSDPTQKVTMIIDPDGQNQGPP